MRATCHLRLRWDRRVCGRPGCEQGPILRMLSLGEQPLKRWVASDVQQMGRLSHTQTQRIGDFHQILPAARFPDLAIEPVFDRCSWNARELADETSSVSIVRPPHELLKYVGEVQRCIHGNRCAPATHENDRWVNLRSAVSPCRTVLLVS